MFKLFEKKAQKKIWYIPGEIKFKNEVLHSSTLNFESITSALRLRVVEAKILAKDLRYDERSQRQTIAINETGVIIPLNEMWETYSDRPSAEASVQSLKEQFLEKCLIQIVESLQYKDKQMQTLEAKLDQLKTGKSK